MNECLAAGQWALDWTGNEQVAGMKADSVTAQLRHKTALSGKPSSESLHITEQEAGRRQKNYKQTIKHEKKTMINLVILPLFVMS